MVAQMEASFTALSPGVLSAYGGLAPFATGLAQGPGAVAAAYDLVRGAALPWWGTA